MIKISALNDESASGQSKTSAIEVTTKEAQEEAAFTLYNRGLEFLNENNLEEAEDAFREIVKISSSSNKDSSFISKEDQKTTSNCPSLLLLYSAYKNLANIDVKREDYDSAMESYIEAVALDSSDVTLWFRIGTAALKLNRFSLASLAFQEALKCNPNHWPSLENVITVLYVLNDYNSCLYNIAQILKRDPHYVKGLAIRDKIFYEHPGLRKDCHEYFSECDNDIYYEKYDKDEGQKFIDQALEMRNIKRTLSQSIPPPVLHFVKPLKEKKTWKNLGECLVDLYTLISQASRPISFSCRLNLAKYINPKENDGSTKSRSLENEEGIKIIKEVKINENEKLQETKLTDEKLTDCGVILNKEINPELDVKVDSTITCSPSQSEGSAVSDSATSKKSRKRKAFPFEFMDASSKRRSTRVRNTLTTKKEPDHVNFSELLHSFLPSSLLTKDEDNMANEEVADSEGDSGTTSNGNRLERNSCREFNSIQKLEESEDLDVTNLLKNCVTNTGVLDVLYRYLMNLIDHQNKLWPSGLTDIFVEAYTKVRDHITHPLLFCQDRENCDIKDEGIMTLCHCEFKLDKYLSSKLSQSSPSGEPLETSKAVCTFQEVNDRHFSVDLNFLNHLSLRSDILNEMHQEFCARVLWLRARFLVLQGQIEFAVDCFERILELLQESTDAELKYYLVNCNLDNEISIEHVSKQLEVLQQSKSFGDLNVMFTSNEYQKIVDLLIPTFSAQKDSDKAILNSTKMQDRHFQLLLLQEALCCAGDRQQWLLWGEASLHEVWERNSTANSTSKQIVANTITEILIKLEECISKEPAVVHRLPSNKLKRLINNLLQIIVHKMQTPTHIGEMPFKTNSPWIILYLIIQQEEEKIKSLMIKTHSNEDQSSESSPPDSRNCSESEFGPGMPSSLMLLYSAHEYLGRRGWCCASDGALLLFYLNVLLQELNKYGVKNSHPYKEDLEMSIEQCFYCLYGHPTKKTKTKYLQEHGNQKIKLTWERSIRLFDYFKPKELPGFDSVKTVSVSAELENLFRRIYSLISPEDVAVGKIEIMRSYIDGEINELPCFEDLKDKPIIKELYYLLADYYFKNYEQSKAVRFYLLDVCVNQDRVDSWAGMALARSSRLEQRLNSCDIKFDGTIYLKSKPVIRCFQRALELDPAAANLWIEYGSLTYMLHSFMSRQLKQPGQPELASDVTQMLITKRNEMLAVSKQCFESALECDNGFEEEWLLHYMLGKIAEKMGRPIKENLNHYKLAAKALYLEGARYPKKIQYHNPPNLSLEALEVYYRIHSSIMKFLLKRESTILDSQTYEILESYLNDAAESQFIKFQEKRHDSQNTSDYDDNVQLSDEGVKHKKINPLVSDHDYYKRKRKGLSHEDNTAVKDVVNTIISLVVDQCDGNPEKVEEKHTLQRPMSDKDNSCTPTTSKLGSLSKGSESENLSSTSKSVSSKPVTGGKDTVGHRALILRCEEALRQCLQRFPQHYKSLYRLAHYYYASRFRKNVQWSWDYLLGSQLPWNQCAHMYSPALFSERKNTNFFNGIWRIPIDEIDRSGCFATHMYRSISLVIDVLVETGDHNLVVHLALQLHRNPDVGKKYLRDVDRMYLAKRGCDESIYLLLKRMRQLCREELTASNQTKIIHHLLLLYRAWQNFQKVVVDQDSINDMLIKAFCIFRRGQIDPSLPVLEQAVRFCQQQQTLIKLPLTPTSVGDAPSFPVAKPPKPISVPSDDNSSAPIEVWPNTSAKLPQPPPESNSIQRFPKAPGNLAGQIRSQETGSPTTRNVPTVNSLHPIRSPKLLTADVQSKIKSLDPIYETHSRMMSQVSGFQLEFLRQISQNSNSKPAKVVKSCSTDN